jgi:MFS family permease
MTLAFTQGGYVRRKASIVGENKMAIQGLLILMPALIGVGFSHHTWMLYLSTFFMAIGSAQVIPCITAMVSKYSPASEQGRVLGTFRSLGALGRTIGPLVACVLYWRANATMPYIAGATALLIPILLLRMIKKLDDLPNPD